MASLSTSLLTSLLVVVCLAWHGGVLTSAGPEHLAECGRTCGGYAKQMCVKECRCIYYRLSDFGICLSAEYNETYLPEMNDSRRGVR
ncbi:hypothetical protein MTO96_048298 [Rhipicephalus appendiculatus]